MNNYYNCLINFIMLFYKKDWIFVKAQNVRNIFVGVGG